MPEETYLEAIRSLYKKYDSGRRDIPDRERVALLETYARPLILAYADEVTIKVADVVNVLRPDVSPLGSHDYEMNQVRFLLKRICKEGIINKRVLFESPTSIMRFYWIVEED